MQTQRLSGDGIQKKGRLSKVPRPTKKCGVKFNIMGERLVVSFTKYANRLVISS